MTIDPGHILDLLSITLVTAGVLAWLNHRFVKLPTTIGVMIIAMVMSIGLQVLSWLGIPVEEPVTRVLAEVDFSETVLGIMLAFLLFAGALHVELEQLRAQRWTIGSLASGGVVASTLLVAGMTWMIAAVLQIEITAGECLLFGALISPTDPIAVLGIVKAAGAPPSLETKITGESLFNDGVAVVLFSVLLAVVGGQHGDTAHTGMGAGAIASLLAVEVGGSLLLGLIFGWLAYWMLKTVDDYHVEVLITLALCTGVYSLASSVHSSGPLAVVVAGLFIGNTGRAYAMSAKTTEHLDMFWELVDEILNVILFVLIGMEVLLLTFDGRHLAAGLVAIPVVLLARFASVGTIVAAMRRRRTFTAHAVKLLTWGGLRGGISVALALSLPADLGARPLILTMTYVVVVFSIVVQGLSVGKLIEALLARDRTGTLI